MSRDINDLVPEFKEKVVSLLDDCDLSGYPMRPFFTIRSPFDQAKLWRQSRSTFQVDSKINQLRSQGADFLAHCIESVGPQSGRHVTNAIPGFSWHQWGEAIDCFWLVDGKSEWSTRKKVNGMNGYVNYATRARDAGINSGGFWRSFKDWPHLQMRNESNPRRVYSLSEINNQMKLRFES
ncbi:M15 family metallopeptidase [Photobacterium sp. TY1-4]|uniref:M15 family metallopeptidase n=1 Tax=Photobacterium sp. TY1-4 TaxID=2899122 RepID=UPI0021C04771|nr:M15 family metallopeptidase [Photobacterium sp. TY1-4]UXI04707.1 M15 family metallopeptidase [Photobacterium sp. TY1-4]